jgi:hypothetical protein
MEWSSRSPSLFELTTITLDVKGCVWELGTKAKDASGRLKCFAAVRKVRKKKSTGKLELTSPGV